jgi:hypothetical protein
LDPKEQAKGGFRAHAEREQARRDALAEAQHQADAVEGVGGDAPGAAESQADGERSPYAPPPGRQPKRWH